MSIYQDQSITDKIIKAEYYYEEFLYNFLMFLDSNNIKFLDRANDWLERTQRKRIVVDKTDLFLIDERNFTKIILPSHGLNRSLSRRFPVEWFYKMKPIIINHLIKNEIPEDEEVAFKIDISGDKYFFVCLPRYSNHLIKFVVIVTVLPSERTRVRNGTKIINVKLKKVTL